MNRYGLVFGLLVAGLMLADQAEAQLLGRLHRGSVYNGLDAEAMTSTNDVGRVSPAYTFRKAARNHFTPNRIYTYSNTGIQAGLTHQWNQQEAGARNWHANYQYWRYAEPTALVVPPTAAYQASYGWGVGQVRNYPIHHQYGRGTAGMNGGGPGTGLPSPYQPSHTDQLGVYPIRAPW